MTPKNYEYLKAVETVEEIVGHSSPVARSIRALFEEFLELEVKLAEPEDID